MKRQLHSTKRLLALLLACLLALGLAPSVFAEVAEETGLLIIAQEDDADTEDEPEQPDSSLLARIWGWLLNLGNWVIRNPWIFPLALLSNLFTWPIQVPIGIFLGILLSVGVSVLPLIGAGALIWFIFFK